MNERTKAADFLKAITDHMAEGVLVLDEAGRVMFLNPEAERLLGWAGPELVGSSLDEEGHRASDGSPLPPEAALHLRARVMGGSVRNEEEFFTRRDGSSFAVSYSTAPMERNGQVMGSVTVFRDISEERRAQAEQRRLLERLKQAHEQLLQSEKMASIGQLAAGVAHEINNPVGYVSSNLATLKEYIGSLFRIIEAYRRLEAVLPESQPERVAVAELCRRLELDYLRSDVEDLLRESLEGVARVRQIVQDLKDFSHVDAAEWQEADLHQGLESTLNIVHNEIKYKAEVIKEFGELPRVECIASQINQVFMNVLVNAAHAIDQHGTIRVFTGTKGDDWVWIAVSDNGCGMAPEVASRVFEPFFTTKPVGKGTGLGLSLSYGIVKKHGGHIDVETAPGKGSTFRIWLPVHSGIKPQE